MNPQEQLRRDVERICGVVIVGTAENPRQVRAVDLALQRIHDWTAIRTVSGDETRGGSSSPREVEERAEDRKVSDAAKRDAKLAERLLRELSMLVARYVVPVDASKLPADLPGCKSCAREKRDGNRVVIPRHWSPVGTSKTEQALGLCNWCYDHRLNGEWPPHEVVDLYRRAGGKAAAAELAKRVNRRTA